MIRNNLIDFCFVGGENEYIIVSTYVTCWMKDIKKINMS